MSGELARGSDARVAVLLSGRGSNFLALERAMRRDDFPARIVVVIANRRRSAGADAARELGLKVAVIPHRGLTRRAHEEAVFAELSVEAVDWVCLAGYMRLLSGRFVDRYRRRILNIHPSLLPSFPGLDAQRQALEYGVKVSGCTVHFVDAGLDTGPIVAQRAVMVEDGDTQESLSARILEHEHQLYSEAFRRLLVGPWSVDSRQVRYT